MPDAPFRGARRVRALSLSALLVVFGCHHTSVLRTAPVGEDVQLTLPTPRSLALIRPQGDTISISNVAKVSGRVLASHDGMLEIRVASLSDAGGERMSAPAGARVLLPNDAQPRIERRGISGTRTALAALGLCFALFALGIALGGGGP